MVPRLVLQGLNLGIAEKPQINAAISEDYTCVPVLPFLHWQLYGQPVQVSYWQLGQMYGQLRQLHRYMGGYKCKVEGFL